MYFCKERTKDEDGDDEDDDDDDDAEDEGAGVVVTGNSSTVMHVYHRGRDFGQFASCSLITVATSKQAWGVSEAIDRWEQWGER